MNNTATKQLILDKIQQYDRIIISVHQRPDGDCTGSSKGLKEILKASFPHKEIYLITPSNADYLAFLGEDTDTVAEELYKDALGIQVDTSGLERSSNQLITTTKELIKIDHHIDITPYGDISWVEDERSSCCEMIVDFFDTFSDQLTMTTRAATYLYTGMVTDSGRFLYNSTSSETLRLASILLRYNVDTDKLFAHLYLDEFSKLKFTSYVYSNMKITENGVAHIYVDNAMRQMFNLTEEEASNTVSMLSNIKGCLIWIAFIDCDDGSIRVRLRSRNTPINHIGQKYRGGGHANAAGGRVENIQEMQQLLADADQHIKEYKATNTDWM